MQILLFYLYLTLLPTRARNLVFCSINGQYVFSSETRTFQRYADRTLDEFAINSSRWTGTLSKKAFFLLK